MCSCDGIEPSEALQQSRGGYRKQVNILLAQKNEKTKSKAVNTRSMTRKAQKRKYNPHFHKVGLQETEQTKEKHDNAKKKKTTNNEKLDSDSSFHLSDDDKTIKDFTTASPSVVALPEFELQIENVDSDYDDIFQCHVVDEDTPGPATASNIADIVRRKRKETNFILKNKRNKMGISKKAGNSTKPNPSSSQLSVRNKKETRAEKLEKFLSHFQIPTYWLRVIPSFVIRENEINIEETTTKKTFGRLVSLCTKLVDTSIRTLCPGPGYPKFRKHLIKRMSQGFDTIKSQPFRRSEEEKLSTVIKTLCDWSNKSRKISIERRVIRAVINESFLTHEIASFKQCHGLKQGTGQAVQQARTDGIELSHGRKLKIKVIKRQFRNDTTINKCVNFILSDDNVASVAWGSKRILLQSSGELLLPKLTRKTTIKDMYDRYKDMVSSDVETIKSATFYKICNVLTSSDQAMLNSIDYVTCMLVNESREILQDIIEKAIMNEHREKCSNYVTIAKNFLKNQFKNHIVEDDDDCCFHGFGYALSRDMMTRSNTNDNGCKFPFYVCDYLKDTVRTNTFIESDHEHVRTDAINVINGISNKFKLFLGHQTLCQCQSVAISQIESDMRELCIRSRGSTINAMIIIDFKMKYEIQSSRESTVEHYGKRGLGWHGMAIIFYLYDDGDSLPYKNIIYIDQIMNDSNVQDSGTVVGMLEVGFEAIVKELSFIKQATLVSDNASSYQNHLITIMVGLLNQKFINQLFISAIVHSETQYRKTLLDAHFATTNRHLVNFMKTWQENRVTKINSPRGLAWALSFNKGVKNSMIQLVNFDRKKLDEIQAILKVATTKCSEYYSRANYIGFKRPLPDESRDCVPFNSLDYVKTARLQWKV